MSIVFALNNRLSTTASTMVIWRKILPYLTGIALISAAACSTSSSSNGHTEARYFEFTHAKESGSYRFVAKTSDPAVITKVQKQLNRPFDKRNLHINGVIAQGNDGYNNNWSWHFVPEKWNLAELSIEVCDGRPKMVEENLDYWIDEVGRFCPWSARVLQEVNP